MKQGIHYADVHIRMSGPLLHKVVSFKQPSTSEFKTRLPVCAYYIPTRIGSIYNTIFLPCNWSFSKGYTYKLYAMFLPFFSRVSSWAEQSHRTLWRDPVVRGQWRGQWRCSSGRIFLPGRRWPVETWGRSFWPASDDFPHGKRHVESSSRNRPKCGNGKREDSVWKLIRND